MKATEIQVGDRLRYRGRMNAFDFRVEQVTKHKVGYHAEPCEHRMHYLRLHEVEPIPLTAEILERNGFENNYDGDLGYAQSCGDIIGIHIVGKGGVMDEMYFEHVHELQHALRLCKIEKEIEL